VDAGTDGRGHRTNLLNGLYGDVGSGVTTGLLPGGADGVILGQGFGSLPGSISLTGVVFSDAVVTDQFYTPGEGLEGVTVTASTTNGQSFTTTTFTAGGYILPLPAGSYTVTFTDASGQTLASQSITVDA